MAVHMSGAKELEISLREHRPVGLIYIDRNGVLTQRTVQVTALEDEIVQAYCLTRRATRTFRREQILAARFETKRRPIVPGRPTRPLYG